jgi:hypothetical protein
MQSHAQLWIFSRQPDRFAYPRLIDHQAGGGQNPFPMGANDGLINGLRAAEIIRVDNQTTRFSREFAHAAPALKTEFSAIGKMYSIDAIS